MADFDPDAYLNQGDQESQPKFDPDAYLSSTSQNTGVQNTGPGPIHFTPSQLLDPRYVGAIDKVYGYHRPVAEAIAKVGSAIEEFPRVAGDYLQNAAIRHGAPPVAAAVLGEGTELGVNTLENLPFGGIKGPQAGIADARFGLTPTAPKIHNYDVHTLSAAATAPDLSTASPEIQAAVTQAAQKTGGAVNPEVLARHVEADSLPVPMRLTEGQATQDPVAISQEQNMRGKNPEMAARFAEQNQHLVQNMQAVRDSVGPEVFSTNPVEHGDTLIDAYKSKAAVAESDISSKYQALRDANGGQWPVDANLLKNNVDQALHDKLLYEHAPSAEMSQLQRAVNDGKFSMEQYEAMRTNLARIMRSSSDGNERAAAGIIRDQMEQLPMSGGSGFKDLADSARAAARNQFQALEADPAYKAAVNGTVPPDRFVQKFITGPAATRDGVATMKQNLADNPTATQTMGVAAVDHLRQSAGIDPLGNGNFSQAGYNRNFQALGPKLGTLVDPKTADTLEKIGNVARYTQFQPRGSFVNNSNTFVSSLANYGANAAEGLANVKAGGIPVGTWTRNALKGRAERKAVQKALEPGAGLSRLSSLVE